MIPPTSNLGEEGSQLPLSPSSPQKQSPAQPNSKLTLDVSKLESSGPTPSASSSPRLGTIDTPTSQGSPGSKAGFKAGSSPGDRFLEQIKILRILMGILPAVDKLLLEPRQDKLFDSAADSAEAFDCWPLLSLFEAFKVVSERRRTKPDEKIIQNCFGEVERYRDLLNTDTEPAERWRTLASHLDGLSSMFLNMSQSSTVIARESGGSKSGTSKKSILEKPGILARRDNQELSLKIPSAGAGNLPTLRKSATVHSPQLTSPLAKLDSPMSVQSKLSEPTGPDLDEEIRSQWGSSADSPVATRDSHPQDVSERSPLEGEDKSRRKSPLSPYTPRLPGSPHRQDFPMSRHGPLSGGAGVPPYPSPATQKSPLKSPGMQQ